MCAFGTAIFVSLTGIIGFIGLMVPHIARMLTG
ncbi:iron chelate uptake ABC transporter family permease subunit [Vibrio neptunius]|uniref:Iron chelate uptake ABC transporter family permease subunit n=1 Tax=Vibrio neptunius TaxID=170651 RepID=A0ABS3A3C3_9VIBR|nr:iron chelate uptake ABC transporter family permease subunit [Vibrio neptunius]MBN3550762.1 iron chelate uptake ABC transporter family permease subunit [Vibrio neptunius]MBN3578893.1 iron chelate uptake ABC transporter family permease subunit [Vibrio neptunius]MCH9872558.1 iron chelate uptake ABC transporter family permease subunit [Vibrio neptunius]